MSVGTQDRYVVINMRRPLPDWKWLELPEYSVLDRKTQVRVGSYTTLSEADRDCQQLNTGSAGEQWQEAAE